MTKRLLSAAVGVVILFCVLLSEKLVLDVAFVIVCVMMLFEVFSALNFFRSLPHAILSILSFFVPLLVLIGDVIVQNLSLALLIAYAFILFIVMLFSHKAVDLNDIAKIFTLTFVVSFFMTHIVLVREMEHGNVLVWAIFVGAWLSDTGAFFIGRYLGKRKLIPEISPKKTVEGSIGGILFACMGYAVFGLIVHYIGEVKISFVQLMFLGVSTSLIAQLGDLIASIIKRECHIKDFGSIMPGHGGIFDRFDSILFVAPFVYYFLKYVNFLI